jgi:hypothetical protein
MADLQFFNGNEGVGGGGVGFDEEGWIIAAYQLFWQELYLFFGWISGSDGLENNLA